MCTVTFVPTDAGIFITSNRDERDVRSRASLPVKKILNGHQIIYPEDPESAGSWIALKDNGHCAVLFNGAFEKHIPCHPYRKSRGIVFLEIIRAHQPLSCFLEMELFGIEPFSIILYAPGSLTECRWDGLHKHKKNLPPTEPHIWSSVTLYNPEERTKKEQRFYAALQSENYRSVHAVTALHRSFGLTGKEGYSTVSITCIAALATGSSMAYCDLKSNTSVAVTMQKQRPLPAWRQQWQSIHEAFHRSWIKITHWEYWPFALVYAPVIPYWLWLSVKARSFFFFSSANPSIENAGFVMEKKSSIYSLIPKKYYPKTVLCKKENIPGSFDTFLAQHDFCFPLIAKPDVGQKGRQVKLLHSLTELESYASDSVVDFLLQDYIPFAYEAGIFYCRMPGENSGHITGIVGKEFLSVTGDGVSSIEDLLKKEARFILQLKALRAACGESLHAVLAPGEKFEMPYGNHSRGAKFVDLSHRITDPLLQSIDAVCKTIPGFYYGRLDIKFNSWDELCAGKNFSIIELNGAGSEPTHMYDPSHSLLFAWKEITRHWKLLFKISRLNARQRGIGFMRTADGLQMLRDNAAYVKVIS